MTHIQKKNRRNRLVFTKQKRERKAELWFVEKSFPQRFYDRSEFKRELARVRSEMLPAA